MRCDVVQDLRCPRQDSFERSIPGLRGDKFERGSATRQDFTLVDHLARADLPLDEVRDRFGVPPRER